MYCVLWFTHYDKIKSGIYHLILVQVNHFLCNEQPSDSKKTFFCILPISDYQSDAASLPGTDPLQHCTLSALDAQMSSDEQEREGIQSLTHRESECQRMEGMLLLLLLSLVVPMCFQLISHQSTQRENRRIFLSPFFF